MTAIDEAAGTAFSHAGAGRRHRRMHGDEMAQGPGERIEEDEPLLEVATDKVDTDIPSPCAGVIVRMMADENDVVAIGAPLALIAKESAQMSTASSPPSPPLSTDDPPIAPAITAQQQAPRLGKPGPADTC
jgi:2-oxoglutarate dehydrogenase E2 component (dihydrolipoamide succinyltransferase)